MNLSAAYRGLSTYVLDDELPELVRKPLLIALNHLEQTMRLATPSKIAARIDDFGDEPTEDMTNDFADDEPPTEPFFMVEFDQIEELIEC